MAMRINARTMHVPAYQWEELTKTGFHPLTLVFQTNGYAARGKELLTLEWRLDGNRSTALAKSLALFFTMDDYGQMLWKHIRKSTEAMQQAVRKMDEVRHGADYEAWSEEQQKRFVESVREFEELEEQRLQKQSRWEE